VTGNITINDLQNQEQFRRRNEINRQARMIGAPENSCAFISVLDLLRGANYLSHLYMDYNDNPILAHMLRRNPFHNCKASFADAISHVLSLAKNELNINL
jgi:hypothetical protein